MCARLSGVRSGWRLAWLFAYAIVAGCSASSPPPDSSNPGDDAGAGTDPGDSDAGPSGEPVDSHSFVDKVTAGYQAWFSCAGDFGSSGWSHWSTRTPASGHVTFELYPDVREYDPADLYATDLGLLGNGEQARLYSSVAAGVIETHFRWMEEYGIDGVGVQRFVVGLGGGLERGMEILRQVRAAAERHGRIFYVMYDTTGAQDSDWAQRIQTDWEQVIETQLGLPGSERYAHQDGKPVVNVWGLGGGPGDAQQALDLIRWFHARGVYVAGGIPYRWRDPAASKPGFDQVFAELDLIQPWAVGTMGNEADVDAHFAGIVEADLALTRSRGQAYQRVIWPGFSWSNWNAPPRNGIRRMAGRFFWRQAVLTARSGASAYIAMFDEYDEGTAIAKAAENADMIPTDQYFLTLDADGVPLSSDFYLRLAGAATRMIEGQTAIVDQVPVPAFPDGSTPHGGDVLDPNEALGPDQQLVSAGGGTSLVYQGSDGNLVIYRAGTPIWASNTLSAPGSARMQADGNFVISAGNGTPVFATHTDGNPGAYARIHDDGALVIHAASGTPLWSSADP